MDLRSIGGSVFRNCESLQQTVCAKGYAWPCVLDGSQYHTELLRLSRVLRLACFPSAWNAVFTFCDVLKRNQQIGNSCGRWSFWFSKERCDSFKLHSKPHSLSCFTEKLIVPHSVSCFLMIFLQTIFSPSQCPDV